MHEDQLRYFLSAARCGSFSAAARESYVAQPTISRRIAALERELGTPLFIRQGRSLTLTPTGSYMVEMAQNYLDQCARLQAVCRQLNPPQEELLAVRTGPWETHLLTEPLARFSAGGTRRFVCSSNSYSHLRSRLRVEQPFLALCTERCAALSSVPLRTTPVYRRPWLVAAGMNHPFWQLPAEKRGRLEGQNLILSNPTLDPVSENAPDSASFELEFYPKFLRPAQVLHGGILHTQLAMARAGYGVLILPPWLPDYLLEGLRAEDCLTEPYAPTIVLAENPQLQHPHLPLLKKLCLEHFEALGGLE